MRSLFGHPSNRPIVIAGTSLAFFLVRFEACCSSYVSVHFEISGFLRFIFHCSKPKHYSFGEIVWHCGCGFSPIIVVNKGTASMSTRRTFQSKLVASTPKQQYCVTAEGKRERFVQK